MAAIEDRHTGDQGLISWEYIGADAIGDNFAEPLGARCNSWLHVAPLTQLQPHVTQSPYTCRLLIPDLSPRPSTGFLCEKKPGHEGEHMRSGVFGPLGAVWKITF